MSATPVLEEVLDLLRQRLGKPVQLGRSRRLWDVGRGMNCSVNYSKLLRGDKFFFGLSQEVGDKDFAYPPTDLGDFVILICIATTILQIAASRRFAIFP